MKRIVDWLDRHQGDAASFAMLLGFAMMIIGIIAR